MAWLLCSYPSFSHVWLQTDAQPRPIVEQSHSKENHQTTCNGSGIGNITDQDDLQQRGEQGRDKHEIGNITDLFGDGQGFCPEQKTNCTREDSHE